MEERLYIGCSDGCTLDVNGQPLHFWEDGRYTAKIVYKAECIPLYYRPVLVVDGSAKINDDFGYVTTIDGNKITFFRAGNFGCIALVEK